METRTNAVNINESRPEVDADIESLLAELENAQIGEAEPEVEEQAATEAEIEAAVEELSLEESKQEVYANEKAPEPSVAPTEKPEKSDKPKRVSIAGMSTADAIKAICGDGYPQYLAFDTGDKDMDPDQLKDQADKRLITIGNLAKKEQQKAINMIRHLKNGTKLEVYTELGLKFLIENGSITSASLRNFFMSQKLNGVKGYSQGTAGAQTNQLMHLFVALEIASVSNKTLTPSHRSSIALRYKFNNGIV